jgi:hypothetical protein
LLRCGWCSHRLHHPHLNNIRVSRGGECSEGGRVYLLYQSLDDLYFQLCFSENSYYI